MTDSDDCCATGVTCMPDVATETLQTSDTHLGGHSIWTILSVPFVIAGVTDGRTDRWTDNSAIVIPAVNFLLWYLDGIEPKENVQFQRWFLESPRTPN